MKLRLPSLLCTALLTCMAAASSVHADTFTAEGVSVTSSQYGYYTGAGYTTMATLGSDTDRFYDGGKGTYWDGYNSDVRAGAEELFEANDNSFSFLGDLEARIPASSSSSCTASSFQNLTNDGGLCWAYTSSNVLQYWQSYYGVFAKKVGDTSKAAPVHGYTYDEANLSKLGGTQSLKLNMEFYDHWVNNGGSAEAGLSWYLGGVSSSYLKNPDTASGGYFKEYFPDATQNTDYSTCLWADTNLANFSRDLKTLFGQDDGTKGQIVHLDLFSSGYTGHAVTCYGYETDADGNITAVYIANSDDQAYGLIKLTVKWEAMSNGTGAVLYDGDYKWTYAGKDWRITSMNAIDTPDVLKAMLAEYESGNLAWMGNLESWTNTAAVAEDVNVLPTDETGWMVYAGTDTEHAGYYNAYYTDADTRGVEFNDDATNSTVNVAEDITVATMAVNNNEKAYTFNGGEERKTITTDSFTKTGGAAVEFDNITLVTSTATLGGDVTFDQLNVTGTLKAGGCTITLKGDSSIGVIGSGTENPSSLGDTSLVVSGGTTRVLDSLWTNLKAVSLSDQARLSFDNASVSIAENITSCTATGTLAAGVNAGIHANYCIYVGTMEGDTVKEGTGNVTLAGDMTAGAYIHILNDATVTKVNGTLGNVNAQENITIGGNANIAGSLTAIGSSSGSYIKDSCISIGGDATIGGDLKAEGNKYGMLANISIGGNATIGGKLTAYAWTSASVVTTVTIGGNATLGGDVKIGNSISGRLTVGGDLNGSKTGTNIQVNVAGEIQLGGNASNVDLKTASLTLPEGAQLNNVNIKMTQNTLTMTNVTLMGDSSISSTSSTTAALLLTANDVTFVLDSSNSMAAVYPSYGVSPTADDVDDPFGPTTTEPITYLIYAPVLEGVKVDGSLTLDISYWAEAMRESGMDTVDLMLGDAVEFTEGSLRLYDGEQYITPVYTENGTLQFAIPEPTTATLSLLALAALAARRRRR